MEYSVVTIKESQPINYFVQFKPSGWASFTLNESTGELNIQSDWGTFSHYWNNRGEGVTLADFIVKANISYLVMKFGYNNPDLKEEIDEAATYLKYKESIENKIKETGVKSRSHILDLDEWEENSFDKQTCPESIMDLFEDDFHYLDSLYEYKQSYTNKILSELLLPTLKNHLKAKE